MGLRAWFDSAVGLLFHPLKNLRVVYLKVCTRELLKPNVKTQCVFTQNVLCISDDFFNREMC